jgi:hypothetical protein
MGRKPNSGILVDQKIDLLVALKVIAGLGSIIQPAGIFDDDLVAGLGIVLAVAV